MGRSPSSGTRRRPAYTRRRRFSCPSSGPPERFCRRRRYRPVPATPLHAAIPWIPYVRWPRAFSFWALTIGAMASDLEVVPLWLPSGQIYHPGGLMHPVLGLLTETAPIPAFATLYLVPPAMRWF